jgi:hypothetical protein
MGFNAQRTYRHRGLADVVFAVAGVSACLALVVWAFLG